MPNIDIPTFRAPKRRKTTTAPKPARLSEHSSDSGSDRGNDQTVSFVKPRTQVKIKARSTGIQFSNANSRQSSSNGHDDEAMAVVPVTDVAKDGSSTHGLSNRFIGSGMGIRRDLVENDPNMYVVPYPLSITLFEVITSQRQFSLIDAAWYAI